MLSDSEGDMSENEFAATLAQQKDEPEEEDDFAVSFHLFMALKPITSLSILAAAQSIIEESESFLSRY